MLPPGFSDDVALLPHSTVGSSPSQNRACAIYTRLLTWSIHRVSEHADLDSWFRQRKPLQHHHELLPAKTTPFTTTVQPLKQQLFDFLRESFDSRQIVGYAVVIEVSSQLGFGYFPKFFCLHRSGHLQPFFEGKQLGGKLLAGRHPLHPKPFTVPRRTAVVS
jgi:hypothetical protein